MKKMFALALAMMMALCSLSALAEDVIIVATNPEYPPFEYVEGEATIGYDIDMFDAIAKKAGFEYEISPMAFDAVVSAVATDVNTVGLSGISITDERKLSVNFSEGYINAGLVVIVKADSGYETAEQLKGKMIGVQQGTTGESYARDNAGDAEVVSFQTDAELFPALQAGAIDAVLQDLPVNLDHTDGGAFTISATYETDEVYGFAMKKDGSEELASAVNAQLTELRNNGKYQELYDKYFTE